MVENEPEHRAKLRPRVCKKHGEDKELERENEARRLGKKQEDVRVEDKGELSGRRCHAGDR